MYIWNAKTTEFPFQLWKPGVWCTLELHELTLTMTSPPGLLTDGSTSMTLEWTTYISTCSHVHNMYTYMCMSLQWYIQLLEHLFTSALVISNMVAVENMYMYMYMYMHIEFSYLYTFFHYMYFTLLHLYINIYTCTHVHVHVRYM